MVRRPNNINYQYNYNIEHNLLGSVGYSWQQIYFINKIDK